MRASHLFQPANLTGVILAGGQATRMAGQDKGLIDLAGSPMIDYVIRALRPQVGELLINVNRNEEAYRKFGYPLFCDSIPDFSGPLAGMAAALEHAHTNLTLIVPCDGPWLPADLAPRLYRRMMESGADACTAHDGEYMQPVFALLRGELLPAMQKYLNEGGRRLQFWLKQQNTVTEDFSNHPEAFINVNTPEERIRVEEVISRKS